MPDTDASKSTGKSFKHQLAKLLYAHTPNLTDADDAKLDELRFHYGQFENSDLALRTCTCGQKIDGFYEYIEHLKKVAG